MFTRLTALALFLLAGPALAPAQEVDLTPKFEKGEKIVYQSETTMKQILTLNGMNTETNVTAFEDRSLEILETSDTGWKVKISTPKMQFDLTAQGVSVSFDSDNPDRKPDNPLLAPVVDLLKVVSQMEVTAEIDNAGKVQDLSLKAEGLDSLPEQLKSSLDKDRLKTQFEQEFGRFPTDKVKPGDTWKRTEAFDAGQGQYFAYTTNYKYEGRVTENGKTYDKVTTTHSDPKFDIEAGSSLPLTVKSSDLSMKGSASTILLDPDTHQTVKVDGKAVYKGKLDFVLTLNNMDLAGELDLTVDTKLTRKP